MKHKQISLRFCACRDNLAVCRDICNFVAWLEYYIINQKKENYFSQALVQGS